MTTELAHVPTRPAPVLDDEQVELLKNTICKGATDAELDLFTTVCNLRGLNPFTGQIHFVKRNQWNPDAEGGKGGYEKVATFQTGIDGYRLIADRTGRYAGPAGTWWCGPDGDWRDVWLEEKPPAAAKVALRKAGYTEPIVAIARWNAYVQRKRDGKPNRMWEQMGAEMLAKCAEALAFRKGFPQELSGLYVHEEMVQAGPVASTVVTAGGAVVDAETGELVAEPARDEPAAQGNGQAQPTLDLAEVDTWRKHFDGLSNAAKVRLTRWAGEHVDGGMPWLLKHGGVEHWRMAFTGAGIQAEGGAS